MTIITSGLLCPSITPSDASGTVDLAALEAHLDRLAATMDGVVVLGSSGEHPWFDRKAQRAVVELAAAVVAGRAVLWAGIGQGTLAATRAVLADYAGTPLDAVLALPPTFFPLGDAELIDYFTELADESPWPVVLYNMPQFAGNAISASAAGELATHPNIIGIKDSSGEVEVLTGFLKSRSPSFAVLQGRDHLISDSLRAGADGVVSGLANVVGPLVRMVMDRSVDSPPARAELDELAAIGASVGLVAMLKAAVTAAGLPAGVPISPMRPADGDDLARIRAVVARAASAGHLT